MSGKTEITLEGVCMISVVLRVHFQHALESRTFFTKTLLSVGVTAFSNIWWGGAKSDD